MTRERFLMPVKAIAASAAAVGRFLGMLRHRYLPGVIDLASPPDADSLFVTQDVGQRANIDGDNNLPPPSEEIISGAQRDIVDYHRKLQSRARRKIEKLAAKLLAEAKRIDPSAVKNNLRDIPSKCRNRIDRVQADFDSKLKLFDAREEYEKQSVDQDDEAGEEQGLGGTATRVVCFVIMLAATGFASFALGSDILWGGDSGSLLNTEAAIAIAIIAVAMPFFIAVVAGKSDSVSFNRKRLVFRLAAVVTAALLGLVAFSCAHLIILSADAAAVSAVDVPAVFNAMTTDPGALRGDVNALKGFGVVMVAGFLGFVLGNLYTDAHPGNDDVRATRLHARESRERLTSQLRKKVNGIVDAAEKDVDRAANRLQKQFRKVSQLVEQAEDTQAKYDDYLTGLEETCNLLLERYRQANAAARNTNIPPSFSEQISFRLEGASRKSFFEDGIAHYGQAGAEMQQISEILATVRRELWNLNRNTIHSLDSVADRDKADGSYAYTS